jgi:hypothetical protein
MAGKGAAAKAGGGFLMKLVGPLIRKTRKWTMGKTSRDALKDAAEQAIKKGDLPPTKRFRGRLQTAPKPDPQADKLAKKLNGKPRQYFGADPKKQEFDTISDRYVAQTKPTDFTKNKKFRNQAKATFEASLASGRTPYFHFEGPPKPEVITQINEYAARYGVKPVIDISPL